ncbi:mitochondrial carrier [Suillus paluster]|uniref:mitochondrial carrier n=1 Tax=Suillus paluster TaxID=48578 RepID=UPI001B86B03C|nr:mitochondrial carrier [Suillus paluster]KAG1754728.1 mitochondrial carrier [Suillus paluster]
MIFMLGSLGLLQAILMPLYGALVRFRAHYNPMGLQLDSESEGDVQPRTGPVISSFFAMLRRVHKIEGWSGLYKGLMPLLLSQSLSFSFFFLMIFLSNSNLLHVASYVDTLIYNIFAMLVSLPLVVITNRCRTGTQFHSLRVLLTPTERQKPWTLYLTPGFLVAKVAHIAYVLGLRSIRQLVLPELANPHFNIRYISLIKAIFLAITLLSTGVILTPLEVIAIRLSIQRNHAASEFNSISQEGGTEEAMEYAGADEDVIKYVTSSFYFEFPELMFHKYSLRTEREPYVGFVDCAKRIIEEEGWSTLYRAWWLTILAACGGPL